MGFGFKTIRPTQSRKIRLDFQDFFCHCFCFVKSSDFSKSTGKPHPGQVRIRLITVGHALYRFSQNRGPDLSQFLRIRPYVLSIYVGRGASKRSVCPLKALAEGHRSQACVPWRPLCPLAPSSPSGASLAAFSWRPFLRWVAGRFKSKWKNRSW